MNTLDRKRAKAYCILMELISADPRCESIEDVRRHTTSEAVKRAYKKYRALCDIPED